MATGKKYRDYVLLLSGLGFYFWGEPLFCLIAIGSAMIDYYICAKIYQTPNKKIAKKYLTLGITANLLLLAYFKYTNFFAENIMKLFAGGNKHFELFNILLPIGVSFIVFEKITYLVDVYRNHGKPAKNLLHYLNYVFLFPKLLAGPIIKYHEIEQQLSNYVLNHEEIISGFKRFIRGLIKKVLIADTCAEVVNQIFSLPNGQLSCGQAWLGIFSFTIQIYFDFSGYSDMALGMARMMGFRLKENFNMPYIATSITDFWRRWHISLSTWIKEYLYIPLGGNQVSKFRMYSNLWLCFLLSGLWHGANWTFILWGIYNGCFLIIDKLFWLNIVDKMPKLLSSLITILFVMLGWIIFRANDIDQFTAYLSTLFNPRLASSHYIDVTPNITAAILIGFFLAVAGRFPGYTKIYATYNEWQGKQKVEGILYGLFGFFTFAKIISVSFKPFLYFRF